jgi:hypothetical protein
MNKGKGLNTLNESVSALVFLCLFSLFGYALFKNINGLVLQLLRVMNVGVHCGFNLGVSQPFLNVLDVCPGFDQKGCVRMAQGMVIES